MNKSADMRRQRWTSGPCTAKSTSIKGGKRRSDDCAWKAAEITPGDLSCCRGIEATEEPGRGPERRVEVIRGHSSADSR